MSNYYTPRYTSIAAWAAALGSKAKTRAGQRKAILTSNLGNPRLSLCGRMTRAYYRDMFATGGYTPTHNDKLTRWASANREKAAIHQPAKLAEILASEARQAQEKINLHLTGRHDGAATERDLLTLQADRPFGAIARYGDWVIRVREDVSYDNNKYSKSWHRAHGGAKSVDARWVLIRRVTADGTLESHDITVNAWRGNYLLDALIQAGVVPDTKAPLRITLHRAFNVRTIRQGRILKIYERTLGGKHIDYCIVAGDYTFHAGTVREAIAGLRKKIAAATLKAKGQAIDLALCKSLGFCDTGVRDFAAAYDLDLKSTYSPAEIERRIRQNPDAAAPYRSELRTLANAIGYTIPADLS
jgi:hypothetical protein